MASLLTRAKGSQLYRSLNTPNPALFVAVPQMRIIPAPSATQQYADGTNHDSPGDFEENVATFKQGDDVALVLAYSPDIPMHKQLYQDFISQEKLLWRTLLAPNLTDGWEFEARVSKFDMPIDFAGIVFLNWSLKLTVLPEAIEIS